VVAEREDWRSVRRVVVVKPLASGLVVATSQTTVAASLFFALRDQPFPDPAAAEHSDET
jgi:hypothetical protein